MTTRPHLGGLGTMLLLALPAAVLAADEDTANKRDGGASSEDAALPEITKPPVLRRYVEPVYPPQALAERIEATVVVEIDVTTAGKVENVEVVEPSTHPGYGFEDAVVRAVTGFEFEPAEVDSQPIAVRIPYKYIFALQPERATPQAATAKADAERADFAGQLIDAKSQKPIGGGLVGLLGLEGAGTIRYETHSDAAGRFAFAALSPGEWRLRIDAAGYAPLSEEVDLEVGNEATVVFALTAEERNPYDVLVQEERRRSELERRPPTVVRSIPGTVRARSGGMGRAGRGGFGGRGPGGGGRPGGGPPPGSGGPPGGGPPPGGGGPPGGGPPPGGGSPPGGAAGQRGGPPAGGFAVVELSRNATLDSLNDVGNFVIHGAEPQDMRTTVDGINVPGVFHFGDFRATVPWDFISQLTLYTTGFPVSFGRSTAGILDLELRDPEPEARAFAVDVSTLDSSLLLETSLGKRTSAALGLRQSYFDLWLPYWPATDVADKYPTAPRYFDYQTLVTHRLDAQQSIKAMLLISNDQVRTWSGDAFDESSVVLSRRIVRGLVQHTWTGQRALSNELKLALGSDQLAQSPTVNDIASFQLRDTLRLAPTRALSLALGIDVLGQAYTLGSSQTGSNSLGRGDLSPAAFVEASWRPLPRLQIVQGVRVDYFRAVDEVTVDPRLTLRYAVLDGLSLVAGVGRYSQQPTFVESDPIVGNSQLGAEWAMQTTVGTEYRPLRQLTINTSLFYKRQYNVPAAISGASDNYLNTTGRRAFGAELFVRHDFANNFYGLLAYTLSRAERRRLSDQQYQIGEYDQTHVLTVLAAYQLPDNWQLSALWRLASGAPTTAVRGSIFNVDQGQYLPVTDLANSDRLPLFHQLDLRVDKGWDFAGWALTTYLDIQNVYNQDNVEASTYVYNYDFTDKTAQTVLPFLPTLGVRASF